MTSIHTNAFAFSATGRPATGNIYWNGEGTKPSWWIDTWLPGWTWIHY
jgi:hypothetical protein